MVPFRNALAGLLVFVGFALSPSVHGQVTVEAVFEPDHRNGLVMQVEAAIALSQAEFGVIPQDAANEINLKAHTKFAPLADVNAEYKIVRHRMVALLNVWRRSLSDDASNVLHLGVTTVDIYDTVLILQLLASIELMLDDMLELEQDLMCLADTHKGTIMMGRTLGQHALPITFGKKVSVWLAQNRRNIERLQEVRARLATSGVLKGAVGSYVGLGDRAIDIEKSGSANLGLDAPEPADWRPARDVFAEYASVLAIMSKSSAALGGEVFRLQMTDIGELYERRPKRAVGSSTMPHKRNPSLSESLVYSGRTIPALAEVVLDDVESVFERDNTSRPNRTLEDITIQASEMLTRTKTLIGRLEIDETRMRANIDKTGGLIMSQNIMLFLTPHIGRDDAEHRVRAAAEQSLASGQSFRALLLLDDVLAPHLNEFIDSLLNPENNLGLAQAQVEATLNWIDGKRNPTRTAGAFSTKKRVGFAANKCVKTNK